MTLETIEVNGEEIVDPEQCLIIPAECEVRDELQQLLGSVSKLKEMVEEKKDEEDFPVQMFNEDNCKVVREFPTTISVPYEMLVSEKGDKVIVKAGGVDGKFEVESIMRPLNDPLGYCKLWLKKVEDKDEEYSDDIEVHGKHIEGVWDSSEACLLPMVEAKVMVQGTNSLAEAVDVVEQRLGIYE